MSKVEIKELIQAKKEDLERRRNGLIYDNSSSLLKVLEDEIKELETSLEKPV